MKRKIKLIGLDLDGTLFTDNKRITDHTKSVIQTAIRQGVTVLPCTGRQLSGLPEEVKQIPGIRYAITSNGAAIFDMQDQKKLYTDHIPYDIAADTLERLMSEEALPDIYIDGRCYIEEQWLTLFEEYMPNAMLVEYFKKTRKPVKNLPDWIRKNRLDAEKIHLLFRDRSVKERLKEEFMKDPRFLTTSAAVFNLELNNRTADKGNALLVLADILGIPHEQTMACGDSFNDEAMLRKAGFSVAMGNADPKMKEICDFVTKTNEEDGVAYAIETFVLS